MKPALFIAAVIVSLGTASSVLAACGDPAGPNVNWSNCDLTEANLYRANLRYADLTEANLFAASLIYADLRGANMTGANLLRADLTGANLTGANMSGANMSEATWPDGWICAEGSRGACN